MTMSAQTKRQARIRRHRRVREQVQGWTERPAWRCSARTSTS